MQQEHIQFQKGSYQNTNYMDSEQFLMNEDLLFEQQNPSEIFQDDEDNECFDISNQPVNKLKQISKPRQRRTRGRPRKNQNSGQYDNIESMDITQIYSQQTQTNNLGEKSYGYTRKFPKDHHKQNMVKLETKAIRLFHEIQSLNPKKKQYQDKSEDQIDISFYEQFGIFRRLDWNIFSNETGYNNNSVLYKIYSYINEQIKNPSDPYGQEFISLSIENFIVSFFLDKAIDQNEYQFQDMIDSNMNHNPSLRFYQLALDDLCQILLSEISISMYSDYALVQVSQYFKILKQLSKFIPQNSSYQNILPLKIHQYNITIENQMQIELILPFQMQNYNIELINSSLVEIIKYFNLYWTTLIESKFRYYGIYIQFHL